MGNFLLEETDLRGATVSKVYRVLDGVDAFIKMLVFAAFAVMVYSTSMQVLGRYVFAVPFPWTEELSRRMMTWILFTASTIGYRGAGMVGIDILTSKFSDKMKKRLDILVYILVACFGVFMVVQGYELTSRNIRQQSSALGISMYYVYIILPVSGFLFFLFSIELIIKRLTGYKKRNKEG